MTTFFDRPTAEVVSDIESALRTAGREPASAERWEGDGVWLVFVAKEAEGASSRSAHVCGNDNPHFPAGADLSDGMGGDLAGQTDTLGGVLEWLAGVPEHAPRACCGRCAGYDH